MFDQLDLKKDGKIDAEELAVGLQDMGYSNLSQVVVAVVVIVLLMQCCLQMLFLINKVMLY